MGSTDVWRPLRSLLLLSSGAATAKSSTLPPCNVFLVTDGHVTEEQATLQAIRQVVHSTRLFTFGVGLVYLLTSYVHTYIHFSYIEKLLIVTSSSPLLEWVQDVMNFLILKLSQNGKERYMYHMNIYIPACYVCIADYPTNC